MPEQLKPLSPWRERLHEIIFEADTKLGKTFDVLLMICIVSSILAVMAETVQPISEKYGGFLFRLEWGFTIIFTIEYIARLMCVRNRTAYATSAFGIIDLVAILPTYLSLVLAGSQYFLVVRALRLLRIFRIFKLGHYLTESEVLTTALKSSRPKITVFLMFISLMVTILGSLMYLVEGGKNPQFSSIPESVYWAIVTLTTVGYGDIAPQTPIGQLVASIVMIMGYGVIAVPTGIVTSEIISAKSSSLLSTQSCTACVRSGHDKDATFCKYCGERLNHHT